MSRYLRLGLLLLFAAFAGSLAAGVVNACPQPAAHAGHAAEHGGSAHAGCDAGHAAHMADGCCQACHSVPVVSVATGLVPPRADRAPAWPPSRYLGIVPEQPHRPPRAVV